MLLEGETKDQSKGRRAPQNAGDNVVGEASHVLKIQEKDLRHSRAGNEGKASSQMRPAERKKNKLIKRKATRGGTSWNVEEVADDTSAPFLSGPNDQSLLANFKNHMATTIWNNMVLEFAIPKSNCMPL
ncbi:hypothetical protein Syun_012287 [Stephania yunnanensis]|uniref:Uncharacterized protein n=1 Tax=Stephania yunnanensis TaxID=152371 RepID=A0AAP0JZA2_9MAGN